MVLRLFTNVLTLKDSMEAIAKGLGASRVVWITAKARTNGFLIGSTDSALDGFRVAEGMSVDIPINELVGKVGIFGLDGLYWKNTVAGSNAVVEIIGMRDI